MRIGVGQGSVFYCRVAKGGVRRNSSKELKSDFSTFGIFSKGGEYFDGHGSFVVGLFGKIYPNL